MKLEIEKDDLIRAVEVIDRVPQRAGIPSSDYVYVKGTGGHRLTMALASDVVGRAWVNAKDGERVLETEYYLDRRLLVPFVLAGKERKAPFVWNERSEAQVTISQGNRLATLEKKKLPLAGYGKEDAGKEKTIRKVPISESLGELLAVAASCSTADPSTPHLNCVYAKGGWFTATNQVTLFGAEVKEKNLGEFALPPGLVNLLADGKWEHLLLYGDTRVRVVYGGKAKLYGYIEGTVVQDARRNFPKDKVRKQLEKAREWNSVLEVEGKLLGDVIGRLVTYLSGIRREDWVMRISVGPSYVKFSAKVGQGEFVERVGFGKVKVQLAGQIEWPLQVALPVLEYMGKRKGMVTVRVDEGNSSPYLIEGAGVQCLIARRIP